MDSAVQPLTLKLSNLLESNRKANSQSSSRKSSQSQNQQETNFQANYRSTCQSSTTGSLKVAKNLHETTPTLDAVTPINWKFSSATAQQHCLERRKQPCSWRERQARQVERRKEERHRNSDSSTVSLHSSRPISDLEVSRLLSVNHPNPRLLQSQSRIKANEAFSSGYDCFMSFKPRRSKRATARDQSFHGHQAVHNARLLGTLETQELVTVKSAQQQIRTTRCSARLMQRCHSPTPRTPPASRVSSAMPVLKRQRPKSVQSVINPLVIQFPSTGSFDESKREKTIKIDHNV